MNSVNKCSHAANSGLAAHSESVRHNHQQHHVSLYVHHYNDGNNTSTEDHANKIIKYHNYHVNVTFQHSLLLSCTRRC